jgi:hypothetical protein
MGSSEPLLEAWILGHSQPMLALYGQPAPSYTVEWKTNLLDANRQTGWGLVLTSLWQTLEVPRTNPAQFFRAVRE